MDGVAGPSLQHEQGAHNKCPESASSNSTSSKESSQKSKITRSDNDGKRQAHTQSRWRSHEQRSISKSYRFIGSDEPQEALHAMREVLDRLEDNAVQGPQLFRLDSEFGLELGRGAQFKVSGPTPGHVKKLKAALNTNPEEPLVSTLEYLASSVVKRALWTPEHTTRPPLGQAKDHRLSSKEITKELNSQLNSAKNEIARLCHMGDRNHPNIVRLRGWGLCLDTFEATTPLNTRIPLLILERATCDLGDFLASSNYENTRYDALVKICADIGNGLGGLHRGNMTHGDLKPENVLLFAEKRLDNANFVSDPSRIIWTAKLCDFGNAETKDATTIKETPGENKQFQRTDKRKSNGKTFTYDGTYGWTPPEALLDQRFDFEGLKRCDLFVYGLIVWRVFAPESSRGTFDSKRQRRTKIVPPIIEEESKVHAYMRDLAYVSASRDITNPSRGLGMVLKDAIGSKGNADELFKGISLAQPAMHRILRVIRASLEPVPRFRDPRPWKYWDEIMYPIIRVFDRRPRKEVNISSLPAYPDSNTGVSGYDIYEKLSQQQDVIFAMTKHFLGPVYALARTARPALILKSSNQRIFESMYKRISSKLPLGWDHTSMAILEHPEGNCYDLSPLVELYSDCNGFDRHPSRKAQDFQSYCYMRIRSRFKLCCWKNSVPLHHQKLFEGKAYRRNMDESINTLTRQLAWRFSGEIGAHETRVMESMEENGSRLWDLTFASGLPGILHTTDRSLEPPFLDQQGQVMSDQSYGAALSAFHQSELFSLFLESGCFVGCEIKRSRLSKSMVLKRNDTALSKYLSDLVMLDVELTQKHLKGNHTPNVVWKRVNDMVLNMDLKSERRQIQRSRRLSEAAVKAVEATGGTMDGAESLLLEDLIVKACARVIETSAKCLSLTQSKDGSGQDYNSMARRRFFFQGVSPDLSDEELAGTNETDQVQGSKRSTILHEATFACCYSAVEYIVLQAGFPLMIRDGNNETALNLAVRMKAEVEKQSVSWRLVELNLIIGLLARKSKVNIESDLPLGWERLDLGPTLVGFQETTINPRIPSLTFEEPKFSLLQETQITLGSRETVEGSLKYKFDLVRFIHSSRTSDQQGSKLVFDESWYKNDIERLEGEARSFLELAKEELLKGDRFRTLKIILFSNYVNILLVFVPICLFYRALSNTPNPVILFCFAALATVPLVNIIQTSLSDMRPSNQTTDSGDQTVFVRLSFCLVESLIGISSLLYHDLEIVRHLIIGSIICNVLFIPGICFTVGGLHNNRTGTTYGIEQDFNSTAFGTVSQLVLFGAVFSTLLYAFFATASAPSAAVETSILTLSRAMSVILLLSFFVWLWFRHRSHMRIFDTEFTDGYVEVIERYSGLGIPSWVNVIVILICLPTLVPQTESIALSLRTMSPALRNSVVTYLIPFFLPINRHSTAIQLATKDNLGNSLDLSLGYSITLCLFYGPLLVILSWCLGDVLTLQFDLFGTVTYLLSALIITHIVADGKSNWLKGVELLVVYVIFMLAYGFLEYF